MPRYRAGMARAARGEARDAVDRIIEQWRTERPDLDPSAKGVTGRIIRLRTVIGDRFEHEAFGPHGLSGGDYGILATLRRAGEPFELTPTALARHQMVTSGGMTAMLDRLERLGALERVPNPNDRRGVLVRLTPSGRALVDAAMESHAQIEHEVVAGLGPKEREQLADLLRKLLLHLEPS